MGKILRHAQNISTNEEDIDELENKLKEAKYILSVSSSARESCLKMIKNLCSSISRVMFMCQLRSMLRS
jgi:uncharacterized protein YlbG (UPF0298 family)